MKCKCGSYAINPHLYGRDNTDQNLCDICYWRKRANNLQQLKTEIRAMCIELECTTHEKFDSGMYHALRGRLRELSSVPVDN